MLSSTNIEDSPTSFLQFLRDISKNGKLNVDDNMAYSLRGSGNVRLETIYDRFAFTAPENSIRITFDSRIRANEANFNIFDRNLVLNSVMSPFAVVLEVKYNGFLLSYIKHMLLPVQKSELSVSKYCMARQVGCNYRF